MAKQFTLYDGVDSSKDNKKEGLKHLEEQKEKLINSLEIDEKMSSVQAPKNIVEYMKLAEAEDKEKAEIQTPKIKEDSIERSVDLEKTALKDEASKMIKQNLRNSASKKDSLVTSKPDSKKANMETVLNKFDTLEKKIDKVIKILLEDKEGNNDIKI